MLLLGEIVRRHARYRGSRLAYVLDHADGNVERVTYAELDEGTNRLAHTLAAHGVRRGDRVAILAQNCVEYPWTYFACCKLGAIVVPVNTRYQRGEIEHAIQFSEARIVLVGAEFLEDVRALVAGGTLPDVDTVLAIDGDPTYEERSGRVRFAALAPLLAAADATEPAPADPPDERDPHVMLYTSGTTGKPKGALLSQRTYYLQSGVVHALGGLTERDIGLSMFPMFHMGGWATPLGYWSAGGTAVVMRRADPAAMLRAVERERVTYLYAVPTVYESMLARPDFASHDFSSLHLLGGGTAYMPREQIDRITKSFGVDAMLILYGQTEAGPVTCLRSYQLAAKAGSVGTPVNHVDVRLVDDAGNEVPDGTPGEIVVKSDLTMLGYWKMPEATAAAYEGGWLHTGDLAVRDDDGFLHIAGRSKEMIKSGGENIFPAEIEQLLRTHPGVGECAVLGVPDDHWGESVLVVIVPRAEARLGEADIVQWVRERVAGYKKPRHVRFVEELPRTASTRQVQKTMLRERFLAGW
ncbi:MAG: long-chain-fatty-acid--CoA ligase [Deltaproteobacteria bacterium]|nr:long-chain-fatty-acid--CoA ligase [Deltaproteobacteria bacterium]